MRAPLPKRRCRLQAIHGSRLERWRLDRVRAAERPEDHAPKFVIQPRAVEPPDVAGIQIVTSQYHAMSFMHPSTLRLVVLATSTSSATRRPKVSDGSPSESRRPRSSGRRTDRSVGRRSPARMPGVKIEISVPACVTRRRFAPLDPDQVRVEVVRGRGRSCRALRLATDRGEQPTRERRSILAIVLTRRPSRSPHSAPLHPPTPSTNPIHQPHPPTPSTNPIHQPHPPTPSTNPIHQPHPPTPSTNPTS